MERTHYEKEIRDVCLNFFKEITKGDPTSASYLAEKEERINTYYEEGEVWVAFQMLHMTVRTRLFSYLSPDAKDYLLKENTEIIYHDHCRTSNDAL